MLLQRESMLNFIFHKNSKNEAGASLILQVRQKKLEPTIFTII